MNRAHVVTFSMIGCSVLLAVVTVVLWVIGMRAEPPAEGPMAPPEPSAPARNVTVPPADLDPGAERAAVDVVPDGAPLDLAWSADGLVIDAEGSPVADVEVGVLLQDDEEPSTARSGADGRFRIVAPSASCLIEAIEPGWTTLRLGEAREDQPLAVATVVAMRAVAVSGVVVEPGGTPLRRAKVDAFLDEGFRARLPDDPAHGVRGKWQADVDGEGRFVLERVPAAPGTRIVASSRGFRSEERTLDPDAEDPLRFVLEPLPPEGPIVTGMVVLDDGRPAKGAEIVFGPVHEHAGEQGQFRLEVDRFDEATPLVACLRGWQPAVLPRYGSTIHVTSGELPPERLVLAGRSLSIAGRVVDEQGAGGKGWRVSLLDGTVLDPAGNPRGFAEERVGGRGEARTRADGSFEITGLADRAYALLVSGRDRSSGFEVSARSDPIPAGSRDTVVVVPSPRTGEPITGRLVTTAGDPVPGAAVGLGRGARPGTAAEYGLQGRFRTTTGPDGRFEIASAPTGLLHLVATAPSILPVRVDFEPGTGRSDVSLVARERRRFVFDGSAGTPLPEWIRAVDGTGAPVLLWTIEGSSVRALGSVEILDGSSEELVAGDDTGAIVVGRGGRELGRVPFVPLPGGVARVRWP